MFEAVGVMGIEAVSAEAPADGVQRPAACRARAMDEEAVAQRPLDKGAACLLTDVRSFVCTCSGVTASMSL